MAKDVGKALPVAHRVLPESVMQTAALALELHLLTAQLDESLMRIHFFDLDYQHVTEQSYLTAYCTGAQFDLRLRQVELTQCLAESVDRYIASRILYTGFKLAKKPAQTAGLHALYGFLEKAFAVLRPLGGAKNLISNITQTEQQVLINIQEAADNPFLLSRVVSLTCPSKVNEKSIVAF